MSKCLFSPIGVEDAGTIDPLVGVRAKQITLRLDQVGGQRCAAVAVVIGERGAEGGCRHARVDRLGNGVLAAVAYTTCSIVRER